MASLMCEASLLYWYYYTIFFSPYFIFPELLWLFLYRYEYLYKHTKVLSERVLMTRSTDLPKINSLFLQLISKYKNLKTK